MTFEPFLRRVVLSSYRSIGHADVRLGPLTYLVGRNGAGKSNFLDALRLIAEALNGSLDQALGERGGLDEMILRSDPRRRLGIRLELALREGAHARYAVQLGARTDGGFAVEREACDVDRPGEARSHYLVDRGVVAASAATMPPAVDDRLYLVNAAGLPEFRPVFDALAHVGVYNIDPERVRRPQPPDRGDLLKRDGRNLASVIARLERPELKDRLERLVEFLGRVVPGIARVHRKALGHLETVELVQRLDRVGAHAFPAIDMSDGTLRALGVMVAMFQPAIDTHPLAIGLEEPETSLHPAAAAVLRDCIAEASRHVQIIVTSHSGDLLDDPSIGADMLRAVEAVNGRTEITAIDPASRSALRDKLYSAGELLRAGQLGIDPAGVSGEHPPDLFEGLGG